MWAFPEYSQDKNIMQLSAVQATFPGVKCSCTLWIPSERCSTMQPATEVARCHCKLWYNTSGCPKKAVPHPSVSTLGENLPQYGSASPSGSSYRLLQVFVLHIKCSSRCTSSQPEQQAKPWKILVRKGCEPAACWRKITLIEIEQTA